LNTAAALGLWRSKILLPEGSEKAAAPVLRAALAHEWTHIRHGDLWLLAIERALLPLVGWHPLFWLSRRGVRFDQELLADAAAAGDRPIEYAEALLAWARGQPAPPLGVAALSLWQSPHTLSRRIAMLVDPKHTGCRPTGLGWKTVIAIAALGLIGGLSFLSLAPLTADEPQSVPATTTDAVSPASAQAVVAGQPSGDMQVKVFTVRSGDAVARADMLRGVLGEGSSVTKPLRISADPRTNNIVAAGSAEDLAIIFGILTRLDETALSDDERRTQLAPLTRARTSGATTASDPIDPQLRQELQRLRRDVDRLLAASPAESRSSTIVPVRPAVPRIPDPPATGLPTVPAPPTAPPAATAPPRNVPRSILPQPVPVTPVAPPAADPAPSPPARTPESRARQEAQLKVQELEMLEAQLEVDQAKAELADLIEQRAKNPGSLSAAHLAKAELQVRRAEIRVEKLKVMLEAERQQTGSPSQPAKSSTRGKGSDF
jgi:hypothetical protein